MKTITITIQNAIDNGVGMLQELRDELQEVVDNAPENLRESERIQTLSNTVEVLDSFVDDGYELESDELASETFEFKEMSMKGASRAYRRDQAVRYLEDAAMALSIWLDAQDAESNDVDLADDMVQRIEDAVANAYECEFPGMMG